jgi:hypothetical protein
MKFHLFAIFSLLLLTASACKTGRRATSGELKNKSEKVLMKRLLANQLNADWLSAKARITYQDEYTRQSVSSNVRIKKDSLIWMNFKKFGLEGGRALITPDSVYVIDRLNGEFLAKPFDFLQKTYHLPVGFQGLQAMLLGNPVFFSQITEASVDQDRYRLSQKTDNLKADYWMDGAKYLLREFFVDDFRNSRSISATAGNYGFLPDNQPFSYLRTMNLKSKDFGEIQVEIDFSKVEINVPKSIPFDIPAHYDRVD